MNNFELQGVIKKLEERKIKKYFADFPHWIQIPYWTLDEGVALLLDVNPKYTNWNKMKDQLEGPDTNPFPSFYFELRDIVLRAQEMKEITDPIEPIIFVEWAKAKGLEIPKGLQQAIMARKNPSTTVATETENLLTLKDEAIAALQEKVDKLESLVWNGFDETKSTYSKELAIAVKAHAAVSKNWKAGSSIKKQISAWLQENYPELMNEEKERIAKICNWQKSGGAPVTP